MSRTKQESTGTTAAQKQAPARRRRKKSATGQPGAPDAPETTKAATVKEIDRRLEALFDCPDSDTFFDGTKRH